MPTPPAFQASGGIGGVVQDWGRAMRDGPKLSYRRLSPDVGLVFGRVRSFRFVPHFHDTWGLPLVIRGAMASRYDNRDRLLAEGCADLLAPGTVHTGAPAHADGWTYVGLSLATGFVERIRLEMGPAGERAQVGPVRPGSVSYVRRLAKAILAPAPGGAALDGVGLALAETLRLLGRHADAGDMGDRVVARMKDFLSSDLSMPVGLDDLVQLTGLSRTHIVRSFRRATGLPPLAWRRQYRLSTSCRLLLDGEAIARIAADLGFADQSHFTRHFRNTMGVAPAAYARGA